MNNIAIKEVRDLWKTVQRWKPVLAAKDYDGAFLCNSAYPGSFEDAVKAFLKAHLQGREEDPRKGLLLATYLEWKGEAFPRTLAFIKLSLNEKGSWHIKGMEISRLDRFNKTLKEVSLKPRSVIDLPSKKLALGLIMSRQQAKKTSKRHGI
ncbi:hypothetical protein KZP23_17185 [Echinicola marina]|uniref:hypothetical protein n=1 Tax=Echinicola marina TaxID=2859768 RepID=UPI001CF70437|nr:hypothetical protein [Echinicola marina]UCS92417.1 hypothetical protein KZP23_17185 [Echinicola marina]